MKDGLNNKQFIVITLVIMLCGIAIFGRDYVQTKMQNAKEQMIIAMTDEEAPEYLYNDEEENTTEDSNNSNSALDEDNESKLDDNNINSGTTNNTNNSNNNSSNNQTSSDDTSGRVKKPNNNKSKYVGRIKIPKIGLNKGFVESKGGLGNMNKCVDYNVCAFSGSNSYPNRDGTHLILGAHNGSRWNAFFNRIEQLKVGDKAYIDFKGKRYKYKLVETYKDAKGDYAISFHVNDANKQLSLFTCASPNYNRYYSVLSFKLTSEEKL